MSRSSEQLDRPWRDPPPPAGPEGPEHGGERSVPVLAGEAEGRSQERREPTGTEPEVGGQRSTRGPTHAQKSSPLKENSEPGADATAAPKSPSGSASPASGCSSRPRLLSGPRGRRQGETSADPPSPGGLEASAGEIRSAAATRTEPPSASRQVEEVEEKEKEEKEKEEEMEEKMEVVEVVEVVQHPETEDEKSRRTPEAEARGSSEGEGEGETPQRPPERPRWEELVEAAVGADPSLGRALYPLANRKTALMLMEQLLSEDTLLMEEHYKKKQQQRGAAGSAVTVEGAEASPPPPGGSPPPPEASPPEASSPPPVASPPPLAPDGLNPPCADLQSKADVAEKKVIMRMNGLLAAYIEQRLGSLEETRGALRAEVLANAAHGAALEALVRARCSPLELERYQLFIGDLERVVSLLLCLSARLARVQNALSTVDQHTDAEEKVREPRR
ncbi:Protein Shroom1 [Liparis tanakae]|uniref:Protein Shroom1 n=1 Tax=Liparis tanakae TaxID=230148 RepID=A0A4Z2G1Y1_9TELE|nr:Protein Shroom1 [Liparis tanakae]